MRIAIDNGPLKGGHAVRGVGFYTRNLLQALEKQVLRDGGITIDSFDFVGESERLANYDVIHYPYFDLFFRTLPVKKPAKTVVTVHDVIQLIYPKYYPPGWRGRARYRMQRRSLKNAARVITDTETSKKDIVRFLGVKQGKIRPVHLAAAGHYRVIEDRKRLGRVREKYRLPDEYVLYVGDVNYNKNVIGLAEACGELGVRLVVVGKRAAELDRGSDLKDLKGPKDWVRFLFGRDHPEEAHYERLHSLFERTGTVRLGFVEDEDLAAIYNLAEVYCQPSFYEGFGLPVLEAMACGCPVAASKTQALVEIAEGAAEFFDPRSVIGMKKTIGKVFADKRLRKELIRKGKKMAAGYSWEKTARETLEVYKEVYGK